jgi:hypothetical protein
LPRSGYRVAEEVYETLRAYASREWVRHVKVMDKMYYNLYDRVYPAMERYLRYIESSDISSAMARLLRAQVAAVLFVYTWLRKDGLPPRVQDCMAYLDRGEIRKGCPREVTIYLTELDDSYFPLLFDYRGAYRNLLSQMIIDATVHNLVRGSS